MAVYIGGVQAQIVFAGLTPTVGGLYQINVVVPSGLTKGDNIVEVLTSIPDFSGQATVDVDVYEALIPIGG
jgi:uncharacterized protein (TIGR03437 family)